jgi:hypothetical protein
MCPQGTPTPRERKLRDVHKVSGIRDQTTEDARIAEVMRARHARRLAEHVPQGT